MAQYGWTIRDDRGVYCRLDHGLPPARSHLPFPMVISDEMDAVQSQLDGQFYTSKSRLRETYRAAGVTEVGNDPARNKPFVKPKPDRKAIRDTTEKAIARFKRGERVRRPGV